MISPETTSARCRPGFVRPVAAALFLLACWSVTSTPAIANETLYVDYSDTPDPAHLIIHDTCILSADTKANLAPGHAAGNRFFAYLSAVEVNKSAPYRARVKELGIPAVASNPDWDSEVMDITNLAWRKFFVEELTAQAAAKGFDGFFLDTLDSIQLGPDGKAPKDLAERWSALESLVRQLKSAYPDKAIILNRGFEIIPRVVQEIDGVLVESVFQTFSPGALDYRPTPTAQNAELRRKIAEVQETRLPVYVIDYVDPARPSVAKVTRAKLRDAGCIPFVTTHELQGRILPPLEEVPRRILVLYGYDPGEAESRSVWPTDTLSASIFQMPLEWMGYELEYHNVAEGVPVRGGGPDFCGVIFDRDLDIPFPLENAFADWTVERHEEGKKILFAGYYPFEQRMAQRRVFKALGIRGEDQRILATNPRLTRLDRNLMDFEVPVSPNARGFRPVQAPVDAAVAVSIEADAPGRKDAPIAYDPVYTCDWGGVILQPYLVFNASSDAVLGYVDPFKFLSRIWPDGEFPAPDPTTRDGLRAFYTHIDGDGFTSLSHVKRGATSAEVLHDEVLKNFPYPITISVVTSEIQALMLSQKTEDRQRYEEIARKIFALPQVQAASHSFSHPYVWIENDPDYVGMYETPNLQLKLTARYPVIDLDREIIGSVDYINKNLLPPGKTVELMLWSGNCRPSPEALRLTEALGIENMNGGNTILSRRYPAASGVSPRISVWDGELQIHASNQNEFMYTNGWTGPLFGGFQDVVQTFEMTELPRRLNPVNVYYHFYSAERPDALKALQSIYEWCQAQELHAMTAASYAKVVRDTHRTRLYRTGIDRWMAVNRGKLRTFRVPQSLGVPDVHDSTGVTGYHAHEGWFYIHTDGSPRVEISLTETPIPGLFLDTSTAETEFSSFSPDALELSVRDVRPIILTIGGAKPGHTIRLTSASASLVIDAEADASGLVRFRLPASGGDLRIEALKKNASRQFSITP